MEKMLKDAPAMALIFMMGACLYGFMLVSRLQFLSWKEPAHRSELLGLSTLGSLCLGAGCFFFVYAIIH